MCFTFKLRNSYLHYSSEEKQMNNLSYPPPWDLKGEGFILPFIANPKTIQNWLQGSNGLEYLGGLGAIMLVNYESSNVGPYYELLLISGNFKHNAKIYKSITKIYVSSELSVTEGKKNWGIPKELAQFEWKQEENNYKIKIQNESGKIFFELKKYFFPFPITTSIYPISLLQKSETSFLRTSFIGTGMGYFSSLKNFQVEGNIFPNLYEISKFRFPVVAVSPFKLVFPTPTEVK